MSIWRMEQELKAQAILRERLGPELASDLDIIEGETNLLEAVDRCLVQWREAKAEKEMNKGIATTYTKRAKAAESRENAIKTAVHYVRLALAPAPLKRPLGTVYGIAQAAKVKITAPEKVPNSYRVNDFTPPPDDDRILADLLANDKLTIDGCELVPEHETTGIR